MIISKPVKRSKFRLFVSKKYFILKRFLWWKFSKFRFAKKDLNANFDHLVFAHSSIIYRQLQGVDMELQKNKENNLRLAFEKINGIVIHPGETLSYWQIIGKPEKSKGYKKGVALFCGKIVESYGGGLCQLSNLIYWMALHTPLDVVERYRHSYDVFPDVNRTQPFGSGATCVYNYRDLMIKNNTDNIFQLCLYIKNKNLHGIWKSKDPINMKYEIYEKDHKITHELWGGYVRHNCLYRKTFDKNGKLIDDCQITENHALMMYEPFLEGSK